MILVVPLLAQADPAEALNRELLAASSATAVLQRRCAEPIRAEVDRGAVAAPSSAQRARLELGAADRVAYRSVVLKCGGKALSVAQNWYVPARLTPEMNAALAGDTPFGAVIRPLAPHRRTVEVATRRSDAALAPYVLRHRALVLGGKGQPLAEVVENYTPDLLSLPVLR